MNIVAKCARSLELELEPLELERPAEHDAGIGSLTQRVDAIDWFDVEEESNGYGCAILRNLLTRDECDVLTARYPQDDLYRSFGWRAADRSLARFKLPMLIT